MKQVTVKKVGVGSLAKVVGITQAVFAFVVGILTSLSVAADVITNSTSFVQTLGISLWMLGLGAVLYPFVAFIVGWVQGALAALILNFVFAESNGLKLETEDVK